MVMVRLLPDLPFRLVLTVDLVQLELLPTDLDFLTISPFHPVQPHGCVVDIGSGVIRVDD